MRSCAQGLSPVAVFRECFSHRRKIKVTLVTLTAFVNYYLKNNSDNQETIYKL